MLADFILSHRQSIIEATQARVASRATPNSGDTELTNGIPVFLDQLCDALRMAESGTLIDHDQISRSAGRHGRALLRAGLTIAQVVHAYGDVCQTITEMAVGKKAPILGEEFRTLNLCLDDAIAEAVTVYARHREHAIKQQGTERLGILAHELRNLLNVATLSFDSIRSGQVAAAGSTGLVHARSLMGLRDLIDRSLTDVRLDAGLQRLERISVTEFVEELEIGALIQAQPRGIQFTVTSVDPTVTIEGDRQILAAAVSNLIQNAFKFTRENSHVSLTTSTTADRVLLEVEDECGGLPAGEAEDLFRPFELRGTDHRGLGLGLSICLKAAKANGGELRVRDIPGKGCVFTLDLPRKAPAPLSGIDGGLHGAGSRGAAGGSKASDSRPELDRWRQTP